jgi:hypothetical protein
MVSRCQATGPAEQLRQARLAARPPGVGHASPSLRQSPAQRATRGSKAAFVRRDGPVHQATGAGTLPPSQAHTPGGAPAVASREGTSGRRAC